MYTIYTPDLFPLEMLDDIKNVKRPPGNQRRRNPPQYKDIVTAFDIETTRIEKYEGCTFEQSVMYVWQWAFGTNKVVIGRTWEEYQKFVARVHEHLNGSRLIVYVHNLSYEWCWLKSVLEFDPENVFAMDTRKIAKCQYMQLEFRCSYIHSNSDLASYLKKWNAENQKLDGDAFDYSKTRYPWTELTKTEIDYCCHDVIGLVEALTAEMDHDGDTLYTIPLTSTGYVRRKAKKAMRCMHSSLYNMLPDFPVFAALREAFRGGNTHANRYRSNVIVEKVSSADRSSSYPDVLVNRKYPMSEFRQEPKESDGYVDIDRAWKLINIRGKAALMRIALTNVRLRDKYWGCPYLSRDKSRRIDVGGLNNPYDNGRILKANYLEITVTDVDFKIIISEYDAEITIIDMWTSTYAFLPYELRSLICDLYHDKTSLKGVTGREVEYAQSKAHINAVYGMCVTSPIRSGILYDKENNVLYDPWDILDFMERHGTSRETAEKQILEAQETALEDSNRKAFLSYAWGVWCTAYAREALEEGLRIVGDGFIYCDTDSLYFTGDVDFSEFNCRCIKDDLASGAWAEDSKGTPHYMGVFEFEHGGDSGKPVLKQFKTMGAKKYVYDDDGAIKVTIAGVNKKKGAEELQKRGGINAFKEGFIFREAGGTEAIYNDVVPRETINIDGHLLKLTTNVVVRESEYTLGLTMDYRLLLNAEVVNECMQDIRFERLTYGLD